MKKRDKTINDIELTVDFIRAIIDKPKIADQIPDYCEIEFIGKDFSSVKEEDLSEKFLIKVEHKFNIIDKKKPAA